ncbi:MAG: hypothetical protein RL318_2440 [Fibrobacterota bacterium]|jgi:hypothetical protein
MLAMTCTHAQRILAPDARPRVGQLLMEWEPVIPTLFALLLGAGLAFSLQGASSHVEWKARQVNRALWLWVLSAGLFFLHFGPQWPALLTSTGILQCLGAGILAVSLVAPSGPLALSAGLVTGFAWMGLEARGLRLDGLNQGSFPLFPYLPMVLLSFGAVHVLLRRRVLQWGLGIAGILATLWMWHFQGWGRLGHPDSGVVLNHQMFHFTRPGQNEGFTLVADLLRGLPAFPTELAFWHVRPFLALFLLVACATAAFLISEIVRICPKPFALLSLAGRHSLSYYVLHFAGLGAFLVLPSSWRSHAWTWAIGALVTFSLGTTLFGVRELLHRKTRA